MHCSCNNLQIKWCWTWKTALHTSESYNSVCLWSRPTIYSVTIFVLVTLHSTSSESLTFQKKFKLPWTSRVPSCPSFKLQDKQMKEENHCNGEGCFSIFFLLLAKKNIEGNLNTLIHIHKQLFLYSPFPNHYLPQCTEKENRKRTGLFCACQQNNQYSRIAVILLILHVALAFKYACPRMQTDTWHIHVVTMRNLGG